MTNIWTEARWSSKHN